MLLRRIEQIGQQHRAALDVSLFLFDQPGKNSERGRLVDRIGRLDMRAVMGNQMRFQHAIDSDQPLDRVLPLLLVLDHVHEGDKEFVGRLGELGLAAQLAQALAESVGVQRVFVDLARHLELDLQLGCERDPARHHAHHALFGVAVIHDVGGALADAVDAVHRASIVKCHR